MANKMVNNNSNTEIVEKLVKVNRCTSVTKGGRKFSFSVIVVVGDKSLEKSLSRIRPVRILKYKDYL